MHGDLLGECQAWQWGGEAMRIAERAADTAVDPSTDSDGDDSLSPTADYDDGGAGGAQGTDDDGPCPHRVRGDPEDPAAPLFPPARTVVSGDLDGASRDG